MRVYTVCNYKGLFALKQCPKRKPSETLGNTSPSKALLRMLETCLSIYTGLESFPYTKLPVYKAIIEVYEKTIQVWALKKNIRPVLLDTLAAMYVTCNMFLVHCFDFSKSNNDFSFQKVHFFKAKKILRRQKKSHISR